MECDEFNPYKVRVTLLAPAGKGGVLENILSKIISWVDPSFQIIRVEERLQNESPRQGHRVSKKSVLKHQGKLVTPALSVMLFVQEAGALCVKDVETQLKKRPWAFHHCVELQKKSSPRHSLAKQEFYKLADDQPLWTVCPIPVGNEHLRFSIYVHNFSSMVAFYRAVTDTEIESNKPEFCIFQLYTQPGLDIQLSLKHSKYIHPMPVDSAYLSFNVKDVASVKLGADCDIIHVNGNVYTTRDPDGNLVVLYETSFSDRLLQQQQQCAACCNIVSSTSSYDIECSCSVSTYVSENVDNLKSCNSSSDSQDSGRCSDMDGALTDNVFVSETDIKMSTLSPSSNYGSRDRNSRTCVTSVEHMPSVETPRTNTTIAPKDTSRISEGYCSSASSSGSKGDTLKSTKGKAPVKRTTSTQDRYFKSSAKYNTDDKLSQGQTSDNVDNKTNTSRPSSEASMYI